MALITETGDGLENANTYADVAFADAYHLSVGNAEWAGDTAVKEQALAVACQAVDLLYAPRFLSSRLEGNQALNWPRYPFADRNGVIRYDHQIPVELKRAQAEIALMYLNGADVFPEGNREAAIESEQTTVGDIATATKYRTAQRDELASFAGFRKVDLLLWSLLKGRQSHVALSR